MSVPRVDHVGVIVADLEAATERFTTLLGVPPAERRELPEVGLRVVRFEAANVAFELLEYASEGADFARAAMGGTPGLNHVALDSHDLATHTAALMEGGLAAQPGFPTAGAHGPVVFFERDAATGVLFELCGQNEKNGGYDGDD